MFWRIVSRVELTKFIFGFLKNIKGLKVSLEFYNLLSVCVRCCGMVLGGLDLV